MLRGTGGSGVKLVIIANPSVKNPGPKKISIVQNNVRGFIKIKDLEMNGYISDIIILHETWLKNIIKNKQAFPENYKVL